MTERSFVAAVEHIPQVLAFVEEALEPADCSMRTQTAICVAMEELFANIARYAYPSGSGEARLAIDFDPQTRIATFVLTDTGVPFDPLKKPDPDITKPAEEREIGGLGIFIVKKTMGTVAYVRTGDENRLTLTKKL